MSSTTNTELLDFQRTVKAAAEALRSVAYGADRYVDQFLADTGLDNLVEDVEVTVKVTVPAADPAAATTQVEQQIASLYLPSGWSATVSS
jgi:hypothetical protein